MAEPDFKGEVLWLEAILFSPSHWKKKQKQIQP